MILLLALIQGHNIEVDIIAPNEPPKLLEPIKKAVVVEIEEDVTEDKPVVENVTTFPPTYEKTLQVCDTSASFASYMDYRMITRGKQLELQHQAYTNGKGYREVNGKVMIAMQSRYGVVGDQLRITFSDNSIVDVILGDIKANTDCSHYVNESESSIIEIIVDINIIQDKIHGKILEYSKSIIKIEKEQ